jgi:hypothetical protein
MVVDVGNSKLAMPSLTGAIRQAAKATGAGFDYLVATAQVESGFDATAQAPTSSARGLFQFIDQTWLATMKDAGSSLGYGQYANAISRTASGDYTVADPGMRAHIMGLRQDPAASAAMAGAFTQHNAAVLTDRLQRAPTEGELYIAHFFGSSGAAKLISLASDRPNARAADVFPNAARANHSIFYDGHGNTRSVAGVYDELVARYQTARNGPASAPTSVAAAAAPVPAPDTAGLASAYAKASESQVAPAAVDDGAVFHNLFRSPAPAPAPTPRGAIAPLVSALWSSSGVPSANGSSSPAFNGFDLFRDAPVLRGSSTDHS